MSEEFVRIEAIRERLSRKSKRIHIGIGDDAAVLAPSGLGSVLSVDAAVEGVHFRREWLSLGALGRRCVVTALSDLAAMGAHPAALLLSLILPKSFSDEELYALIDGCASGADEYASPIVGGNLSSGSELSITTTVVGHAGDHPLTRAGAQEGDGIYVTGTIGTAAMGLFLLTNSRNGPPHFVERWAFPTANILIGQRLVGHATSTIDISDGLHQDLGHLCKASNVGATIQLDWLPVAEDLQETAADLGVDPVVLCLGGGEDYELLFTAPASEVVEDLATRIGRIDAKQGIRVLKADGTPLEMDLPGYQHS